MKKDTLIMKIGSICLIFMLSVMSAYSQCSVTTSISEITQISAKAQWTTSPNATSYDIQLRTTGSPIDGTTSASGFVQGGTANGQSNSFLFTSLVPSTTYRAFIKANCSDPLTSEWSTVAVIFTTSSLQAPFAVDPNYISATSYVANWNASAGATQYEIDASSDSSFPAGSLTETTNVGSNLLKLVGGLTPSTTYYYRVRARVGDTGGWTGYSLTKTVLTTAAENADATWTGNVWSSEPTIGKNLIFAGNYNTLINGNELLGRTITINPGVTLTIGSETYIRITQNIINNGNLVIESNGNIDQITNDFVNSGSGVTTVNRNSFPIYRLDYTMWSSPVVGQNLFNFSNETVPSRFYSYNSEEDIFETISEVDEVTMSPGEGYLVRAPNNYPEFGQNAAGITFNGLFTGQINNGNVEVELENGYNMVGNPYPCDISADRIFANNDAIEPTLWFWRRRNNIAGDGETTSFYATYTTFGGTAAASSVVVDNEPTPNTTPNGFIKTGQGFMVKSKRTSTLVFNNSMKQPDNIEDIFLKKANKYTVVSQEAEKHKFYLSLSGASSISSEILLGFAATGSDDLDPMDGAYIGDSPIALTSLINSDAYVIQAKALPFQNTSEFALRFQTSVAASYTISLGDVTGMFTENVDPILVDMLTNTETNLRNASYTFASEIGIFDTRFKIVFVESALGTVDVVADANAIVVMSKDNVLSINAGTYTINNIQIYDMLGRNIYSKQGVDANTTSISDLRAQNQIILVQVATDHGVVTKKVQF